jgi:hypothetical protein
MKLIIPFIALLLLPAISDAQHKGKDLYRLDSIQEYSPEIKRYVFNIDGPSQGLYFGTFNVDSLPRIEIEIINNTKDTLMFPYRERDCSVLWMRKERYDTIAPGQSMILWSAWLRKIGTCNCPIQIKSNVNGESVSYVIQTWGRILPSIDR